jgi:hypothetical protein
MLESSWNLEDKLSTIIIDKPLKGEIYKFIKSNRVVGKSQSFSNLYYRSNLQYIIDNISKEGLYDELVNFNMMNVKK